MKHDYPKQFYVTGLMIASLLLGILFFITNHVDFIIKAFETTKFNLPNVCYAILRIFTCIIFPTIFVAPSLFPYSRVRISKVCFWIVGVLQLLTTTWIFYFLLSGYTFGELFSREAVTFFQQNISNAFVSSQVFWDTYDLISVLFTFILSALYIALGINFDDNRLIVRWLCVSMIAFKLLVPMIYSLIVNQIFFSSFWFTNNFVEFLSTLAFVAAICVASIDDETWVVSIWDEEQPSKEEN